MSKKITLLSLLEKENISEGVSFTEHEGEQGKFYKVSWDNEGQYER